MQYSLYPGTTVYADSISTKDTKADIVLAQNSVQADGSVVESILQHLAMDDDNNNTGLGMLQLLESVNSKSWAQGGPPKIFMCLKSVLPNLVGACSTPQCISWAIMTWIKQDPASMASLTAV